MGAKSLRPAEDQDLFGEILCNCDAQAAVASLRKDRFDLDKRSEISTVSMAINFLLYVEWVGRDHPSRYARSSVRRLDGLPRKLRTLADELKTEHVCLLAAFHGVHRQLALKNFSELPKQLREAATFLDDIIAKGKVGPARRHRVDILDAIEKIVVSKTGKPHRKEICDLLQIACRLAGKGNVEIDPNDMKQGSYRRRHQRLDSRPTA